MTTITSRMTLTGGGGIFNTGVLPIISGPIRRTVDATTRDVETKAKEIYLEKRKTDKLPSMIISSFGYETAKKTGTYEVTGIVFAGGSKAPYAIYLENDRKLANGKKWSSVNPNAPYKFMEGGLEYGAKTMPIHFYKEMLKIAGTIRKR